MSDEIADAITDAFTIPDDHVGSSANVADGLLEIARALNRIADALQPALAEPAATDGGP